MVLKIVFSLSYLLVILGSLGMMAFASRFPFSTRIKDLQDDNTRFFCLDVYQVWRVSWILVILGAALQFLDYWRN